MRWMNSESIRNALQELLDALKRHDSEMGYVIDCRQRVKQAQEELDKAEERFGKTQEQLEKAQARLKEEGFLTHSSVYEETEE